MLTTRDHEIIDFLNDYKLATTSTIAELFFPSKAACYKRLEEIHRHNYVKRTRDYISQEYIYHAKKELPKQIRHSLLVTDFYRELHKLVSIITYKIEPVYGDIRPDASFGYTFKNINYIGLLEVEISHKGFNYAKYERFYSTEAYKTYLPIMPTVFVVGDNIKLPSNSKVKYKVIKTDFSNLGMNL